MIEIGDLLTKATELLLGEAAKSTVGATTKWVRTRLGQKAKDAAASLADDGNDESAANAFRRSLRNELEADPRLQRELQRIVAGSQAQTASVTGSGATIVQIRGDSNEVSH